MILVRKNISVLQPEGLLSTEAGALRSPRVPKYRGGKKGRRQTVQPLAPAGRMQRSTRVVPGWDAEPRHGCQELHYPSARRWQRFCSTALWRVLWGDPWVMFLIPTDLFWRGRQERGKTMLNLKSHISLLLIDLNKKTKFTFFSPKARITIISRVPECYYHVKSVCQPSQNVGTLNIIPSA